MTPSASPALPELPRVRLLDGPTPLQRLPGFSAALGDRSELWIKREDLGPLTFSGNKLRNLEFLLGSALAAGADTIITSGRRWSNHCRLTAAAGARLGLEVHVIVSGPPVAESANVGLMRQLGATVHEAVTDHRGEREALVEDVARDAESRGRRARVLPVGGSDPIGAWGQVLAALELIEQAAAAGFRPDAIVLPTATGGTHAGLVLGAALGAREPAVAALSSLTPQAAFAPGTVPRILGVAVHPDPALRTNIERMVGQLAGMAGIEPPAQPLHLDDEQLGPGYGRTSAASAAAARLLATTEGILVDPVYTAKALAGLVAQVRAGAHDGKRVVFWHGGGLPALFEPGLGS